MNKDHSSTSTDQNLEIKIPTFLLEKVQCLTCVIEKDKQTSNPTNHSAHKLSHNNIMKMKNEKEKIADPKVSYIQINTEHHIKYIQANQKSLR